jgi:hypothetical protein
MSTQKTLMLKPCRIAFPKLSEPDNYKGQGKKKYSVRALFPKGDKETQKLIKDFAKKTVDASNLTADEKKKALSNCTVNKDHDFFYFKDGDEKANKYAGHAGHYYLNLKATGETKEGNILPPPPVYYPTQPGEKPKLIPAQLLQAEMYSGAWAIFIIRAWASALPKPGVFLQISEIMKFKDDEPFRKSGFENADYEIPETEIDDIEEF